VNSLKEQIASAADECTKKTSSGSREEDAGSYSGFIDGANFGARLVIERLEDLHTEAREKVWQCGHDLCAFPKCKCHEGLIAELAKLDALKKEIEGV